MACGSRALALDQRGAVFLIFVPRKPHLLKRAQRGENRTANPRAVLPLEIGRRRLQLDLDGLRARERVKLTHIRHNAQTSEKPDKNRATIQKTRNIRFDPSPTMTRTEETLPDSWRCNRSLKPAMMLVPPIGIILPASIERQNKRDITQQIHESRVRIDSRKSSNARRTKQLAANVDVAHVNAVLNHLGNALELIGRVNVRGQLEETECRSGQERHAQRAKHEIQQDAFDFTASTCNEIIPTARTERSTQRSTE